MIIFKSKTIKKLSIKKKYFTMPEEINFEIKLKL
jgi:hypothetical protein